MGGGSAGLQTGTAERSEVKRTRPSSTRPGTGLARRDDSSMKFDRLTHNEAGEAVAPRPAHDGEPWDG